MQQKRVISSNGIICFEHHKVSFDISCVILQTHAQQYIACTALLSQAKTSCSILLHTHFTILVFTLVLLLAGCSQQAFQSASPASAAHVHQAALVQSLPLLWQQPLVTPAIVLSDAPEAYHFSCQISFCWHS
jgi:hypothetical protein